ncbi:hypothetical protein NEDG_00612 [Nematocida displodere]|uniref:DUF2428 domain-containing protein n=1 Tax=Nematocida displodere TaxID=1805483 RepID=A0A177EEQ9_9MICR|nr:hypothetical protein NEDG_00612 [Nematocida displodere]
MAELPKENTFHPNTEPNPKHPPLFEAITRSRTVEEKLFAAHKYFSTASKEAHCLETLEGINYLAMVKGKISNRIDITEEIDKIYRTLSQTLSTHHLRVGLEVVVLHVSKLIKSTAITEIPEALSHIATRTDVLIPLLNEKMLTSHYVIRMLIKEIVKELVKAFGEEVLESSLWSPQNRATLLLALSTSEVLPTEEEVRLLNDKEKGESIVTMLQKAEPSTYTEYLNLIECNAVGARNLRVLSKKVSADVRKAVLSALLGAGSLNAVYFVTAREELKEYLVRDCPICDNEEIRTEYLEAVAQRIEASGETVSRVASWLERNQFLGGKEAQKRARASFDVFTRKIKNGFLKRHYYLESVRQEDPALAETVKCFKHIVAIVLTMCASENGFRHLQGLYYLQILQSYPETTAMLSEKEVQRIVLQSISTMQKETREIASKFSVAITPEEVVASVFSPDPSLVYGAALLFTSQPNSDRNKLIQLTLGALKESKTLSQTHRAVHVLWSVFNGASGVNILVEGNRLNPYIISEQAKRKAKNMPKLNLSPPKNYTDSIYTIQLCHIVPLFFQSLSVLQARDIYASTTTTASLSGEQPSELFAHHWYILKECSMFLTVFSITSGSTRLVDLFFDTLLKLGGHVGAIMVLSQCIKNILVFFGCPAMRLAYAEALITAVTTKTFKTVRRDGGIPYAFKALSASESMLKHKKTTHYIMKTVIGMAFDLIGEGLPSQAPASSENTIHCLNILKGVCNDGIFRYDMREYEPSLFQLSISLISHGNWKIRNAALMLYTTLIKKMCKDTLNALPSSSASAKYAKISVRDGSRKVLLESLAAFDRATDENGVFSCLVFFARVPYLEEEEERALAQLQAQAQARYSQRTTQKIAAILTKVADTSSNAEIVNAHHQIPLHVATEAERLKDALSPQSAPLSTLDTLSLLSILGSEEETVRKHVLNRLGTKHTYEDTVQRLLKNTTEKDKKALIAEIEAISSLKAEPEPDALFHPERSNMFRDTAFEISTINFLQTGRWS